MMMIHIKSKFTGQVLYQYKGEHTLVIRSYLMGPSIHLKPSYPCLFKNYRNTSKHVKWYEKEIDK